MFLYQEWEGKLNVVCFYTGVRHNVPIQDCAIDFFGIELDTFSHENMLEPPSSRLWQ